jgi:hypothetical protein
MNGNNGNNGRRNTNSTLKKIKNALSTCFTRSCRRARRAIGMPEENEANVANVAPQLRSLYRDPRGGPRRRGSMTEANFENVQRNPNLYNERSRSLATSIFAERNRVRRQEQEREEARLRRMRELEEAERLLEQMRRQRREEEERQEREAAERIRREAQERIRREAEERARREAEERARPAAGEEENKETKCKRVLATHGIKSRKDFLKWAKSYHPDKVAFAPGTEGYMKAEELFKEVRECAEILFKNGGARTKKAKKNGKRKH